MNFFALIAVFITLYVVLIWIYFKYSKKLNKNFLQRRIKIEKPNEKRKTHYISKPEQVDILRYMHLLATSLNEDGKNTENCVLLDYPLNYPRIFNTDPLRLTKLIDAMTQFFLVNNRKSAIVVKFLLANYQQKYVKFSISVWSNKNFLRQNAGANIIASLNKKSRTFLNKAQEIAASNGSKIEFDSKKGLKISTSVRLEISDIKNNLVDQLTVKNPSEFSILIADENPLSFNILRNYLLYMGFDVKPTSSWSSAKRHIEDMIFKPSLIFISDKLSDEVNLAQVQDYLLEKDVCVVIIQKNRNENIGSDRVYIQRLIQPYLPEMLVRVLNNCDNYRKSKKQTTAD